MRASCFCKLSLYFILSPPSFIENILLQFAKMKCFGDFGRWCGYSVLLKWERRSLIRTAHKQGLTWQVVGVGTLKDRPVMVATVSITVGIITHKDHTWMCSLGNADWNIKGQPLSERLLRLPGSFGIEYQHSCLGFCWIGCSRWRP